MKRLLTALGLMLAGLSSAAAQQPVSDTFVELTGAFWHTLDPAHAFDPVSFILVGNVYESLITFKSLDELDSLEPFLATQVPSLENGLLSKDRKSYTFPIRKGVRFHDGSLLTPEDVRYSLLRFILMDPEGGPAALLLQPILGVHSTRDSRGNIAIDVKQALDAVEVSGDNVVVHLKRPDNAFLKALASLPIVTSKNWALVHSDWDGTEATWTKFNNIPSSATYLYHHMNGTGPFQLDKINWENRTVVLIRHDGYWRKPAALKRVVVKVEFNSALRLFMIETGDADGGYVEDTFRGYAKALKGVRLIENQRMYRVGEMFFFNFKVNREDNDLLGSGKLDGNGIPPDFFKDPDVRRGFAYAFDYEEYFKFALGQQGRRASGPFPPDILPPSGEPAYKHDPAKATAHLRKAYGGRLWNKGFVLPVAFHGDSVVRQIAAGVLRDSLAKLNAKFKVHLQPMYSQPLYHAFESRQLPLLVDTDYADYPDPQDFAFTLLHSGGYYPKYQGYADREVDALVEKAAASSDPQERRRLYLKLSAIAARDVPQIYTYSPLEFKVCRDWVVGCDNKDNVNNLNFNNFPYFYTLSKKSVP